MNLKYIVLSVFISSVYWGTADAQSVGNALKFSQEEINGSARIKGMGNVQTSVGGDISSVSANPAGLGFYTRSDASITFNLQGNQYKTDYLGTKNTSNKTNFGLDQIGAVFYFPTNNRSGWQNFNVGISYNKTQNYNSNLIYEGINSNSTIVNAFTDLMAKNNGFATEFSQSGMVEQYANAKNGYFPLAKENAPKNQYNEVIDRGNKGKTSLSFGANYNDQFYIGGSLGITSFNYERGTKFIENGKIKNPNEIIALNPNSSFADPADPNYKFANAEYELFDNYAQKTTGTGVDLKIGAIYKPAPDWNIGISIATPTWMNIQDDTRSYTDIDYYEPGASTRFAHYNSDYSDSAVDYNMTSPWKFSFGLTKLFSRGLISADVDYVTYNSIRVSTPNGVSNTNLNNAIKDNLQGVANFRIGGEYLFTNTISGRAGFNYFGTPYKNDTETNYNVSAGLGFKLSQSMYLDLAVTHQVNEYTDYPYTLSDFWTNKGLVNPAANISNQRTSGILTLGARF